MTTLEAQFASRYDHTKLYDIVHKTPIESNVSWLPNGQMLDVKLETEQATGSFKARGAAVAVLESDSDRFVTASAGSHGAALAYAAHEQGKQATVFTPESTPDSKQRRIAAFGRLALVGRTFDAAQDAAIDFAGQHELDYVSPYDDERVIAGQQTAAEEIIDEYPDDEPLTIFAPVGGGGLLAGSLRAAAKHAHAHIVGVQFSGNTSLEQSLRAGQPERINHETDPRCEGSAVAQIGGRAIKAAHEHAHILDVITVTPYDVGEAVHLEYRRLDPLVSAYQNHDVDPYEYFPETTGFLAEAGARLYARQRRGLTGNWVAIRSGSNRDDKREQALLDAYHTAQSITADAPKSGTVRNFDDNFDNDIAAISENFVENSPIA